MDNQSIRNEFYNKYSDYSKQYIDDKLKQIGTFSAGESYYSVSGWHIFYAPTQHKLFQEAVIKDP